MHSAVPDLPYIKALLKRVTFARKTAKTDATLRADVEAAYAGFTAHMANSRTPKSLALISQMLGAPDVSFAARLRRRFSTPPIMNAAYADWSRQDITPDIRMEWDVLEARCEFMQKALIFDGPLPPDIEEKPERLTQHDSGDIVIVCTAYPSADNPYAGNFIHQRVLAYVAAGQSVRVCVPSPALQRQTIDTDLGVEVTRLPETDLLDYLAQKPVKAVALHSPTLSVLSSLIGSVPPEMMSIFLHGYETRDYARLLYNFPPAHMKACAKVLEPIHFARMIAARTVFENPDINVVFVSQFLRDVAEQDAGTKASNAHIIPNFINGKRFKYTPKTPEDRLSILAIRPFVRANYGGDLIVKTVLALAKTDIFQSLTFHIQGYGEHYDEAVAPLKAFDNVTCGKGILNQEEIIALHKKNGIFLCPSRHDTQGVSLCEAMSSGLVPVTNAVGGIPEYVNGETGLLSSDHTPRHYAEHILRLANNPDAFQTLSKRAAASMQSQCGAPATIDRELALFAL